MTRKYLPRDEAILKAQKCPNLSPRAEVCPICIKDEEFNTVCCAFCVNYPDEDECQEVICDRFLT
uniref:Uncharacterized protein n=1 Tax=viral metagenome TaxID=1070528 RepID=A0A6M3IT00_9ZZZZ